MDLDVAEGERSAVGVSEAPPSPRSLLPTRRSSAPRPPVETRLRGIGVRSLIDAAFVACGEDATHAAISHADEAVWLGPVRDLATTAWYPIGWLRAFHGALHDSVAGASSPRALRRSAVRLDARGIFKFLLRFAKPELLAPAVRGLAQHYLDGPVLTAEVARPRCLSFRFTNLVGYDAHLIEDHLGGVEATVEVSNGRNARATLLDMSPDFSRFSGEVVWD